MAILQTGTTYSDGNQVTSTNLNAAVNAATFVSGAVDNVTTQLSGSGQIIVKDGGITAAKLGTAAQGQLFIGNGSGFTLSSLTAGTGIDLEIGAGSIVIESTGSMGGSSGSTDNAIIRANGTGGNTIQSSSITIDDSNNIAGANNVTVGNVVNVTSANGYQVNGTKVLGAQGAAINSLSAGYIDTDFDNGTGGTDPQSVADAFNITDAKINTILAALRTHGIIAT
jgi:hypothetical protein